ncbi:MAG: tryptophan 2,3-dioxygenase [Planctomycetes bacterium]|nr:tryptophan 2,3-dioxygenase [Planctomycetota bacterium]
MANEENPKTPIGNFGAAPSANALSYGSYLKIPQLLSLQECLSKPPHHDEPLFIVIHQVYELWFKLLIHEVLGVREALDHDQVRNATRLLRRVIEIQRVLLQQISVLETMSPQDFLQFRDHLNPASGFQSRQFRELEFLSGMKDARSLEYMRLDEESRTILRQRLAEPTLQDAFDGVLRRGKFPMPAASATPEELSAARLEALRRIYGKPDAHWDLYVLGEAMIEFDENFQLWRFHHVRMVERMIGAKTGTGGSEGVRYLAATVSKCCFKELWDVRTTLTAGGDSYGGR